MENQTFLIRLQDQFLRDWNPPAAPTWTPVLSSASHFTYEDADGVCQDLSEIGVDSYVSDQFGNAVTLEILQRELSKRWVGKPGVVLATDPEYSKPDVEDGGFF
jgi:hypothetical protein